MSKVKIQVRRDGTVLADGIDVGRVEKVTAGTSIISALSDRPGPARWIPWSKDGVKLTGWMNTRSEAARVVVEFSQPPTVSNVRRERVWEGGRKLWSASLDVAGYGMIVSRYEGSQHWRIDMFMDRGAFCPSFANGVGCGSSTPLNTEGIAKHLGGMDVVNGIIDMLDKAAIAEGACFKS